MMAIRDEHLIEWRDTRALVAFIEKSNRICLVVAHLREMVLQSCNSAEFSYTIKKLYVLQMIPSLTELLSCLAKIVNPWWLAGMKFSYHC